MDYLWSPLALPVTLAAGERVEKQPECIFFADALSAEG